MSTAESGQGGGFLILRNLNRNGQLIAKETGKLYDTINRAEALKNLGMQSAKELPGE